VAEHQCGGKLERIRRAEIVLLENGWNESSDELRGHDLEHRFAYGRAPPRCRGVGIVVNVRATLTLEAWITSEPLYS
jgi:hypothetical protein